MIRCGFYEHDITPKLGMSRPGHLGFAPAFEVFDPLCCSAAVLGDADGISQVFVSVDALQVPVACGDCARQAISEALSVKPDGIMICATHTHSGGPVESYGDARNYDEAYCRFLTERIIDCAILASKRMRPVKLGFANAFEDTVAHCRVRVLPDGTVRTFAPDSTAYTPIDPEVSCIVIDGIDGSHYGVIVNYACHACCVEGAGFSSDFPGALRNALRARFGPDFTTIFCNGFLGNINHIDYESNDSEKPPMHYRVIGQKLAEKVAEAMEQTCYFAQPQLRSLGKTITVKTREMTPQKVAWAKERMDHLEGLPITEQMAVKEALFVSQRGVLDYDLLLQVHKIGDVLLFATPRELFIEFQHILKARSSSRMNLCVGLANGACSYVPIKELVDNPGCFETTHNRFALEADTGDRIVETLLELMQELSEKPDA